MRGDEPARVAIRQDVLPDSVEEFVESS